MQGTSMHQASGAEVLLTALSGRRSIRSFQERPIAREDLERILEAATWAPSADNLQPWRFAVLQGQSKTGLAALLHRFVDEMRPGVNPILWVHRTGLRRSAGIIAGSAATITAWATFRPDDARLRLVARGDLTPNFAWTMVVQSVAAAVENLLLAAHALGLGAVWLGYPNLVAPTIKSWLGESGELQATIALGYPAKNPSPRRHHKAVSDVVRWME